MLMNDNRVRRLLIDHAYRFRREYGHGIVTWKDIEELSHIDDAVIYDNLRLLKDEFYITTEDSSWELYRITSAGIRLVEDSERLNQEFPLNLEETDFSFQISGTVEKLIGQDFPEPFKQLRKARSFLYEHDNPDVENCIKESVGALEGLARMVMTEHQKTLGELLPKLKAKYLGHPALANIFTCVYAIRGDAPGVAHGAHERSRLGYNDAEFILQVCMACMIYVTKQSEELRNR